MKRRQRIGIVAERDYLRHQIPLNVRESPKRIWPVYQRIDEIVAAGELKRVSAREASDAEILSVHSALYLSQLREHAVSGNPFGYDKDTYLMEDTLYVASFAAGGCIALGDAIINNEVDTGIALVRPPGHHAGVGNGAGFCVLNNVAILAKHLQRQYDLSRIMILDMDAHHGNGTQEIFFESGSVLFMSIHEENLFPANSGAANEIGADDGEGYTINIPVKPGFGDVEYSYMLGQLVQEVIIQYAPQILLVSMGFDTHIDDPISNLALTTDWYRLMARTLGWYVNTYGVQKIMYILEGGYIAKSVEVSTMALLKGMAAPEAQDIPFSSRASDLLKKAILGQLSSCWCF